MRKYQAYLGILSALAGHLMIKSAEPGITDDTYIIGWVLIGFALGNGFSYILFGESK